MPAMDVLVASHLYPSELSRISGSFVHDQVRFLQAHCQPRVVAPVPRFPLPGFGRWSRYRRLPEREYLDGVEVLRPRYTTLPRRWLLGRAAGSYLSALERVAGSVPDVIHGHVAYPDGAAAVAYGRRLDRPVAITVHGHDLKDLAVRRDDWRDLVRAPLLAADAVIAVSGELAQRARDLGVPEERLWQLPNGVDAQLFRPGTRAPGEGGWRLVYVGRYDPAKGLDELLQAVAGLRSDGYDVRLDLVGGGATDLADHYPERARQLGIAEYVRFVREVPHDDLPPLLADADIFVLPSYSEGLPLSLLEALACGLPSVSTRCGGPEEVIDDSLGRLAEPRDVPGLQVALAEVLDGYDGFDRAHIRRVAEERYDYRAVAARIHGVYEAIAAG